MKSIELQMLQTLYEQDFCACFLNDAEWINTTYQRARREAIVETGLSEENFAIVCPFAVDEILDLDFYLNAEE
jgi:hypothetical protein